MRWTVLLPLRALPSAKSRLAADLSPEVHPRLVEAIRADTLAAVRAAGTVARVVVVGDVPGDGVDLVQSAPGLNGALRDGAAHAGAEWPGDGVVALVADLPALTSAELDAALHAATAHDRSYVPDSAGTGTTLLAARPGVRLEPAFGVGSAARHATTATALPAGPGLRHDVDTLADLTAAAGFGVGAHTAAVLASSGLEPRSP